jgi:hypothetical protein
MLHCLPLQRSTCADPLLGAATLALTWAYGNANKNAYCRPHPPHRGRPTLPRTIQRTKFFLQKRFASSGWRL